MTINSPIPFREALQSRAVKNVLPTNMTSFELMQLDASLREKSMFSAQTLFADYLQSISDKVATILNPTTESALTLPSPPGEGSPGRTVGLDMATARLELKQELQKLGYQPDPTKRGGLQDLSSDSRINLVLKMNTEMAQGFGSWRQGQDPAVLDAFPAQELFRAESREKPRDWITRWQGAGGQLYDGRMIALKNDPIWTEISAFGLPYPPFDYNSGMWVRDVDREEAVQLGLIDENTQIQPERRPFETTSVGALGN